MTDVQYARLDSLAEIRRGASPRPIRDQRWFSDRGRGWVRIADVTASNGPRLERTRQYLSAEGEAKSVPVDPGELVMSICATIGVPMIVAIPVCIHDGFVVFRNYEHSLDRDFLYYYLGSLTDWLAHGGQPGTQRNVNTSRVGSLRVPVFPLSEQRKIAEILGTWDEAIALTECRIAAARQRKKGLMQQLLTGRVRFKEFAGQPWREVRLGEVAEINTARPSGLSDDTRVSFVTMPDVSEDAQLLGSASRAYGEVKTGYTSFADGDVLIAKITPCFENGKGAYAQGLVNGIGFGSTEFHVLRAHPDRALPKFLYYQSVSQPFRGHGAAAMAGSAGQKRVRTDFIRAYRIGLPGLREQRRVVTVLESCDEKIDLLNRKLSALQRQKNGLMQRLLTGKVRVKADEG